MPCRIKRNPDRGGGVRFDGRVAAQLTMQAGAGMKPCVVVPYQCCWSGIKGALRRNGGDGDLMRGGVRPLHLHLAVMNSVAAAAGWQVRVRVCGEREQRRHQRKAEEQQQRKCQQASHTAIVADGRSVPMMRALIEKSLAFCRTGLSIRFAHRTSCDERLKLGR